MNCMDEIEAFTKYLVEGRFPLYSIEKFPFYMKKIFDTHTWAQISEKYPNPTNTEVNDVVEWISTTNRRIGLYARETRIKVKRSLTEYYKFKSVVSDTEYTPYVREAKYEIIKPKRKATKNIEKDEYIKFYKWCIHVNRTSYSRATEMINKLDALNQFEPINPLLAKYTDERYLVDYYKSTYDININGIHTRRVYRQTIKTYKLFLENTRKNKSNKNMTSNSTTQKNK